MKNTKTMKVTMEVRVPDNFSPGGAGECIQTVLERYSYPAIFQVDKMSVNEVQVVKNSRLVLQSAGLKRY